MRRQIPGLHSVQQDPEDSLDGLFLVRVLQASYRWHRQKSFLEIRVIVLEPESSATRSFSGRLYCTDRALWKLNWFLHDFGYDTELLSRDQVDEKSLLNLQGIIRTSHTTLNGRSYQNLDAFAPGTVERLNQSCRGPGRRRRWSIATRRFSQYLRCPRSYRYRYLEGWRERETRAAMAFGRCFESALGAYFRGEDCSAVLFKEWGVIATLRLSTRRQTPGIVWCTRASICSKGLSRMTGLGSTILVRISRSGSCDPSLEAPSLWRTWMPWVKSTVLVA
jgi:hypothetical protein